MLPSNMINSHCRILFWNLGRKALSHLVEKMAVVNQVDVIILTEYVEDSDITLRRLQENIDLNFFIPKSHAQCRFQCFCRHENLDLSEVHGGMRTSTRRLNLGSTEALLGLVHGVDIRNYDPESRQSIAQLLAGELRFVKSQQQNSRLVLIGDFNMNPFDRGMNLPLGMNAMMTKECVVRGQRNFLGKDYDFYYNPMWSLLGDGSPGPAGTYYDRSNQGPYGWNMLDQVILNHSIVSNFKSVQIITYAGSDCLLNSKGRPDKKNSSDHLPILVELTKN